MKNILSARNTQNAFALLLATGIPLAFLIFFHSTHSLYPRQDAIDYFGWTQEIFLRFHNWQILDGLEATFWLRNYKPTLTPVIGLPFLFLTGGNVLLAAKICTCFFFFLFVFFVYLLARMFLPRTLSVVATLMIAFIPWAMSQGFAYMSEILWLPLAIATFYYLMRSESFSKPEHTGAFFVFLSIALLVRPVLGLMYFCIPLTINIFLARKKRILGDRDILLAGVLVLSGVMFSLPSLVQVMIGLPYDTGAISVLYWVQLPICILVLLRRGFFENRDFVRGFTALYLIVLGFFGPFMGVLFYYIHMATFSDGTRYMPHNLDQSLATFGKRFFTQLGEYSFVWVMALMVLALIIRFALRKRTTRDIWLLAGSSISMVAVPILLGTVSYNCDMRYYYVAMVIFYLLVITILYSSSPGRWKTLAFILVTPLALLEIWQMSYYFRIFGRIPPPPLHRQLDSLLSSNPEANYPSVSPGEDPLMAVFDEISLFLPGQRAGMLILRIPSSLDDTHYLDRGALQMMAQEMLETPFWVDETVYQLDHSNDTEETILSGKYNFVLLGPFDNSEHQFKPDVSCNLRKYLSEDERRLQKTRKPYRLLKAFDIAITPENIRYGFCFFELNDSLLSHSENSR